MTAAAITNLKITSNVELQMERLLHKVYLLKIEKHVLTSREQANALSRSWFLRQVIGMVTLSHRPATYILSSWPSGIV